MITLDQLKEYLVSQGITLPDFILELLLDQINATWACLTEHYPLSTAKLIALYLGSMLGMAQGDKYISSQTAPNGASRSFRYNNLSDRWNMQLRLLQGADKFGCTDDLVPEDPFAPQAALWVSTGGCRESNR